MSSIRSRINQILAGGSANETPVGDLPKNFEGNLPYDAQYVGTFQPLVGWKSNTSITRRYQMAGAILHKLVKLIEVERHKCEGIDFTGGFADPVPELIYNPAFRWMRSAIVSDRGKKMRQYCQGLSINTTSPKFQDINTLVSEVISDNQSHNDSENTQSNSNTGKNPDGHEFQTRYKQEAEALSDLLTGIKDTGIPLSYLESAFQNRVDYYKNINRWIWQILAPTLSTEEIEVLPVSLDIVVSKEEEFELSPIGLLNLYRHYFFDFGSFLGPPVEHIWIGPCSECELIEVWSQTSYRFRESETSFQFMQAEEENVTEARELSEEMQRRNEQNIKMGFTTEFGYNIGVIKGNGSLSMSYENHLTNDKKMVRKQSRESSSKTATEMKRSVRLLTRESTETRSESTRRHLLKNETSKPISFEMRRKMRRVGVQVQHLGTQLCWQSVIDEPGLALGLAELVHIAKPQDFTTIPPPEISPPSFETISEDYQFTVPYSVINGDGNPDGDYIDGDNESIWGDSRIKTRFRFTAPSPQPGYRLESVVEKGFERTDPEHDRPSLWSLEYSITNTSGGDFEVYLKEVNFEYQPTVMVNVMLIWTVKKDVAEEAERKFNEKMEDYHHQKQREAQLAIVDNLRERINLARSIAPRPSMDLRDEERAILYRRALRKLIGPDLSGSALHATTDVLQTFFEIDKMLYFVAPDWWNPQVSRERGEMSFTVEELPFTVEHGTSFAGPEGGVARWKVTGIVEKGDPMADVVHFRYKSTITQQDRDASRIGVFHSESGFTQNPMNPDQEKLEINSQNPPTREYADGRTRERKINIPNPYYQVDIDRPVSSRVLDQLRFEREQYKRPNNYLITEDSEPAPMGSSIGWLAQLDGDALRNAFLNSAWVRIVIPVRRGREEAAIKWLKQPNIEGEKGFDTAAVNEEGEPVQKLDAQDNPVTDNGNPVYKTVEEAIDELVEDLGPPDEDTLYLKSQEVYETGFDPHEGGFEEGPLEVFAQWVEIVPTNQVVPIEYKQPNDE
jgi:hypothetical protein